jgi:hypothetical protein
MRRPTLALTAVVGLASVPLLGMGSWNPGVIFEITTVDHTRSPVVTDTARLQIEGPDVAMEVSGAGEGGGRMIFHGEAREMIVVDDAERSYMVMDEATLESLANQMNAAMAQMEQMLESLPAEQRAMIERMRDQGMGGMPGMENMPGMGPAPEIEVRATGRSDTRAGYPVAEWEVAQDGVVARRLWITPWSEVDGGDEARAAMVGMVEFFDDFLDALPRMPGQDEPLIRNPFRNIDMAEGLPVFTQELSPEGEVEQESTITAVERRSLGPETFQPPADYQRRDIPGG